MKTHLKDIPVYYLSPDAFASRRKPLHDMLDNLGLAYERHGDIEHHSRQVRIAGGHKNIVQAAIKKGVFPFLILEDDVMPNVDLPSHISIPENAKMIYWGASMYGNKRTWAKAKGKLSLEEHDDNYYRIYRSLGGHAFLIPTLESAQYYLKILEKSINSNQHLDLILAAESNENIFLTPKGGPYFYQNTKRTRRVTRFTWDNTWELADLKKKNVHLNIFTNCTNSSASFDTITSTYKSFVETFGAPVSGMTIYCDPQPNERLWTDYRDGLQDLFHCDVVKTTGLADGYGRALRLSPSDYVFMLEHDWLFRNVQHSLNDIVDVMRNNDIYHMRFNQHVNKQTKRIRPWQTYCIEKSDSMMNYCVTDNLSNNPHIVQRKHYLEQFLPLINERLPGAGLIEEKLTKKGYIGCLYGGIGYAPTIVHTDGRKGGRK